MKTRNWYYVEIEKRDGRKYHEIHKEFCKYLPKREDRIYLGNFMDCDYAIKEAEKHFPEDVVVCPKCCPNHQVKK